MPRALHVFVLLLLTACSTAPARLVQRPSAQPAVNSTVIYVVRRKWHVDIAFAAADLQPPLESLRADFPAARYLSFGFGDRHYLLDKDRGFGGMLAALWPGPGLMLVTGLATTLQVAFGEGDVIQIPVTAAQAGGAQAFIWKSLSAKDGAAEDAAIAPLLAGPYDGSLYYASSERYSAAHTCNTWAAQSLHAAQLPVHSEGVEFAGQLWRQARRLDQSSGADPVRID